ncbi:MAG TPA: histidine kinase [Spirochaeta sp.]|nr:histidine kinase [Spirochaeta sp.]
MENSKLITGLEYDLFFSLIDNMYDEVLVYDNNYKIVYINQACSRHYSCPPDAMIGKSFFDFVDDHWWAPSILPVVYEKKKGFAIKQGTRTNCELLTIAVPLFDDNNEIKYVVMNVRDKLKDIELYNPHYIFHSEINEKIDIPIAESEDMKHVLKLINKMGNLETTCIFTGESGTGKTLIAKYMHSIGSRSNKPFVNINCACIPEELIESELFGYTKGAFSGASATGKKGLIEAADSGTLFLDEISELSFSAQAKLLNVIQDKEYLPIGAIKPVTVDVRIILATNKNLQNMVKSGTFREDLYYRINIIDIYISPLRKRRTDIKPLLDYFIKFFNDKYGTNKKLTDKVIEILINYNWKGNVRELKHLIERITVTIDSEIIDQTLLPKNVFEIEDDYISNPDSNVGETDYTSAMEKYEATFVRRIYDQCSSSRKLAEQLGVSQTKANNLIKKYIK